MTAIKINANISFVEDLAKKAILYDLYSPLLNDKQKKCYEYHIIMDLSFTEIGEEMNMSRQAAYDLYKNADKKLAKFDKMLKLSERFEKIEKLAVKLKKDKKNVDKILDEIIELTN